MGTAPKKSRAARQLAGRAAGANAPASMEFLVFEDNGGDYHWRVVAQGGETLAHSGGFGSYEDAEKAAQRVREGAASAGLTPRAAEAGPVDFVARRKASNDNSDAERWLDEGGSKS